MAATNSVRRIAGHRRAHADGVKKVVSSRKEVLSSRFSVVAKNLPLSDLCGTSLATFAVKSFPLTINPRPTIKSSPSIQTEN
jgi:hypothetical protein